MRTLADLECEVAELRLALYTQEHTLDEAADLRRQLKNAVSALSRARRPERTRELYRRYHERHYARQWAERANETGRAKATRGHDVTSAQRVAEPVGGRCPRPGCGRPLLADRDGCYCLVDGYHYTSAARPLLLNGAGVPPTTVGRWN